MGLMRLLLLLSKYQNLKIGPISDKICHTLNKNIAVLSLTSRNLYKKLFIVLITANGKKDFRARLVNKDKRPSFSTKILLICLGETQFYTSS